LAQRQPLAIGVAFIFLPLAGCYAAPFLLVSRGVHLRRPVLAVIVALYSFGVFLHYVSEAQKYFTLKLQPELITDGVFAHTRNPNYLGEIMI
jgi:steroid 5-alpha reductase family enzyme